MTFRVKPPLAIAQAVLTSEEKRASDAITFRGILQRWVRDSVASSKDSRTDRDHYDAEFDRLVAKLRMDGAVHEAIQVDVQDRLIRGFRRLDASLKLSDEGHPEVLASLRVERVIGFADDYEVKTYIRAGTLSVKTPSRSERRALIHDEIGQDEVRYQAALLLGEAYRSSFNLLGARLGVSYHLVAKVEREAYPERWSPYETGQEKRLDTNGVPKAKRDRDQPSAVQAIMNLFGGRSAETLDALDLDGLEHAYRLRKKDLDPEFVTDSEIAKIESSYEFLKAEVEKKFATPGGDIKGNTGSRGEAGGNSGSGAQGEDEAGEDPKGSEAARDEVVSGVQAESATQKEETGEVGEGGRGGEATRDDAHRSDILSDAAVADYREEVERFAEEKATIEDYLSARDRPFTGGLLSALLDEGLIEVDEVAGKRVVRDWMPGTLRDLGFVMASLAALDPFLRDLGVTPEMARKHMDAMIREGRGFLRPQPEPLPNTERKQRAKKASK